MRSIANALFYVTMTPSSLVIVADRGTLKAYKVDETPTRGPSLRLIQAFDITDTHGRLGDKVTDQAGRFPGGGGGRHANATAERQTLTDEYARRAYRQLAENIVEILKRESNAAWSFAAPSEIYSHIVDLLPPAARGSIVEHVKSDLVKIEPSKLHTHFRSLQPF